MINVVVVEDLEDYRNGLINLINRTDGYICLGGFESAEEAIKNLQSRKAAFL